MFMKDQGDRGLARLMETSGNGEPTETRTRVFAQFLHEEIPASANGVEYRGHGPLTQVQVIGPETRHRPVTRLAPAQALGCAVAEMGVTAPIYFEAAGISLRLPGKRLPVWTSGASTHLHRAGLILPWSSGAGPQAAFSLAPLAAAAWAQPGCCKLMHSHQSPVGGNQLAWPAVDAKVEMPALVASVAPAIFAAFETPASNPMRVQLATPITSSQEPRLELAAAAAVPLDEYQPIHPAPDTAAIPDVSAEVKPGWLSQLRSRLRPTPSPERVLSARARAGLRHRGETFSYDDPLAPVTHSSREAWRRMFTGWTPSPAVVSGLFAILFLVSAFTIFVSAPSELATRPASFRWGNLRSAIRGRASLKFEDDFRAGLSKWVGPSGWSRDWSYDPAGFLRPGKVGFLQQSMSLVNYRMEFMGQIERKSLGWAFRAKDESNYYMAKLTIMRPGPLPLVDLVRYPVRNGKEGPRVNVTLPFTVQNDTLYQVEMNIRGDQFRASVNGHVVDSWTETQLQAGGVGFVSGKGEAARVRWIRVSDHDDMIGRFCSYLSARYQPSEEPVLSASYYTVLRSPGLALISR
jgi:hypothetical protein